MGNEVSILRPLREVVDEYEAKAAGLEEAVAAYQEAEHVMERAGAIGGTWAGGVFERKANLDGKAVAKHLLRSAWKHVYEGLNVKTIAPLKDRERFERELQDPPAFTIDNIRATFGDYVQRPRHHIIKGLAEIFGDLDPAFKSHSKVKVGVSKLPKRIILSGFGSYYPGNGRDKLKDILSAIATYQGKPLPTYEELGLILKDGGALLTGGEYPDPSRAKWEPEKTIKVQARGVSLKRFGNGNGHLHFAPDTLADVNRALAEFYGDVLPDTPDEAPKKRAGTAVATDLQFYPTPQKVIDHIMKEIGRVPTWGQRALEPSCGDGRMMKALVEKGFKVTGIEVNGARAAQARALTGCAVQAGNFLSLSPDPVFDLVLMNPPFFGTHYAKHVTQACRWLKPGGALIAILPITARTDHGILGEGWAESCGMRLREGYRRTYPWEDLPVGSFSESGTNINTTIFRAWKA